MKRNLLVFAVVLAVLAVFSLAFSLLCRYAAYHTLDGSAGLRARQMTQHYISLALGLLLAAGSAALFIARRRMAP